MRGFVKLRRMLATNAGLARDLSAIEKKNDAQCKVIFDALRELMWPLKLKHRKVGFKVEKEGT